MRIYVKNGEKSILIPIPNWFFKSKILSKRILKNKKVIENMKEKGIDDDLIFEFMRILTSDYRGLKLVEYNYGNKSVQIII